jgi:cysteine desulfurase
VIARRPKIVSLLLANNETGVIEDIEPLAASARAAGACFHSDAVQAFGKVPVDFRRLNGAGVHALTLSAHKMGGPKGAAALILDKRIELEPLIAGGGHERGLRSGTENVAAIVGFGVACQLAVERRAALAVQLNRLRTQLEQGLVALGGRLFGQSAERLPNTVYFAFAGVDGETLVGQLDRAGYAVASGAACSSANPEPSHVLRAMGVDDELARGAVRVSLGRGNSEEQVAGFLATLRSTVERLQRLTAMAV